jgi:hypothetical protein
MYHVYKHGSKNIYVYITVIRLEGIRKNKICRPKKYFQACPGMHYGKEPRLISSETTEPRHQCKLAMRTKQLLFQFYIC